MVKCQQVKVPAKASLQLELLSSNHSRWQDGYVSMMNSSACLRVHNNSAAGRAVFFKRNVGSIWRSRPFTVPPNPCATKPRPPTKALPDMAPVPRYLAKTLVGSQKYCWLANETLTSRAPGPQKYCERVEGGIKLGCWQVVRFGVAIANYGTAALVMGNPKAQLTSGLFEYATCHAHYHWKGFAAYELYDAETGALWRTAKRGFCANDIQRLPYPELLGVKGKRPMLPKYTKCGDYDHAGNQGVSVGYMDVYPRGIPGQFFVLNGGDGQSVVAPNRTYYVRITANPGFWRGAKGLNCRVRDYHGLCHPFEELDYDNNVMEVPFVYKP